MAQDAESDTTASASFKEQLDQAAQESRSSSTNTNPIIEKITEYIPAAAKVLGGESDANTKNESKIPGPPVRPDHDNKIEEFVRDQHRNNGKEDILRGSDA
ncbi:hypothetical protein BGZ63DRAFT_236922 [Mariannaea sp. PMI_226]|nr:hypothetical protein BGZ63DRAFT_236922 [Mariannaea sp. PMI_226]